MISQTMLAAMAIILLALCQSCASEPDDMPDSPPVSGSIAVDTGTEAVNSAPETTTAAPETAAPEQKLSDAEIAAIIDAGLDALVSDIGYVSSDDDLIEKAPEAFDEIVALGESALPYLNEIGGRMDGYTGEGRLKNRYRSAMALAAAYRINPDVYNLVSPSPDGKFNLILDECDFSSMVDGQAFQYRSLKIVDTDTGAVTVSMNVWSDVVQTVWSSDSRFAAVSCGGIYVFDAASGKRIDMPTDEIVNYLENYAEIPGGFRRHYISAADYRMMEWVESGTIKIGFDYTVSSDGGCEAVAGWYLYNPEALKITDGEYTVTRRDGSEMLVRYIADEPEFADAIEVSVWELLRRLVADSSYMGWIDSVVSGNWQIMDEFRALGESALPALENFIAALGENPNDYIKQNRAKFAMAAAYAIDPSRYDADYPSPDGGWILRFERPSFDDVQEPDEIRYHKAVSVLDAQSGEQLLSHELRTSAGRMVAWSPEGGYAAVLYKSALGDACAVVDTAGKQVLSISFEEMVAGFEKEHGVSIPSSFTLSGAEWLTEREVRVHFASGDILSDISAEGWFVYDTVSGSITDSAMDLVGILPMEPEPADAVSRTVKEKLDQIMSAEGALYDAEAYIEAERDAFDAMVALGEAALPYLASLGEMLDTWGGKLSGEMIIRCCVAKSAEYAIQPERYDLVYPSPDGTHELRLEAPSFSYYGANGMQPAYQRLKLVDAGTGQEMAQLDVYFEVVEIEWSEDGRYASISNSIAYGKYGNELILCDAAQGLLVDEPYAAWREMLEDAVGQKVDYYARFLQVEQWLPDGEVRILAALHPGPTVMGQPMETRYRLHLATGAVTELTWEYTE